jgi:NAD(P)-dependent dehydrogenase (short-subunit alcohol dehydrogenase family)
MSYSDQVVTKTVHSDTYPAISPLRPELSQAGKTVLVTGGGTGIGHAIAQAFAQAGATTIILLSRRQEVVSSAASKLSTEFAANKLKVLGLSCDVSKAADVEAVWASLARDSVIVDVLALGAALAAPAGSILDHGAETVVSCLQTNVHGHMYFTEQFYKQKGREPSRHLVRPFNPILSLVSSRHYLGSGLS